MGPHPRVPRGPSCEGLCHEITAQEKMQFFLVSKLCKKPTNILVSDVYSTGRALQDGSETISRGPGSHVRVPQETLADEQSRAVAVNMITEFLKLNWLQDVPGFAQAVRRLACTL